MLAHYLLNSSIVVTEIKPDNKEIQKPQDISVPLLTMSSPSSKSNLATSASLKATTLDVSSSNARLNVFSQHTGIPNRLSTVGSSGLVSKIKSGSFHATSDVTVENINVRRRADPSQLPAVHQGIAAFTMPTPFRTLYQNWKEVPKLERYTADQLQVVYHRRSGESEVFPSSSVRLITPGPSYGPESQDHERCERNEQMEPENLALEMKRVLAESNDHVSSSEGSVKGLERMNYCESTSNNSVSETARTSAYDMERNCCTKSEKDTQTVQTNLAEKSVQTLIPEHTVSVTDERETVPAYTFKEDVETLGKGTQANLDVMATHNASKVTQIQSKSVQLKAIGIQTEVANGNALLQNASPCTSCDIKSEQLVTLNEKVKNLEDVVYAMQDNADHVQREFRKCYQEKQELEKSMDLLRTETQNPKLNETDIVQLTVGIQTEVAHEDSSLQNASPNSPCTSCDIKSEKVVTLNEKVKNLEDVVYAIQDNADHVQREFRKCYQEKQELEKSMDLLRTETQNPKLNETDIIQLTVGIQTEVVHEDSSLQNASPNSPCTSCHIKSEQLVTLNEKVKNLEDVVYAMQENTDHVQREFRKCYQEKQELEKSMDVLRTETQNPKLNETDNAQLTVGIQTEVAHEDSSLQNASPNSPCTSCDIKSEQLVTLNEKVKNLEDVVFAMQDNADHVQREFRKCYQEKQDLEKRMDLLCSEIEHLRPLSAENTKHLKSLEDARKDMDELQRQFTASTSEAALYEKKMEEKIRALETRASSLHISMARMNNTIERPINLAQADSASNSIPDVEGIISRAESLLVKYPETMEKVDSINNGLSLMTQAVSTISTLNRKNERSSQSVSNNEDE